MRTTGIIFLLFLMVCGSAGAGKVVTSKGMSFFEPGREAIAREKALDEAKRNAIEEAIGVAIQSRTAVENYHVVKDRIFSNASGYLKNIKVIEERSTAFGTYEVTISAEVESADMVADLERFQQVAGWQKNPRVGLFLSPGLDPEFYQAGDRVIGLLTDRLKGFGFNVFRYVEGQDIQMGLLGRISLENSSRRTQFQDLELTLNEVGLTVHILRSGDQEILGSASATRSMPGENRLQVVDKGSRACVDEVWQQLTRKLTRAWEKEIYSQRSLFLFISNLPSNDRAIEIAAIFKSDVSNVADASVLTFKKGNAEFNIVYRGWPEQFVNEIQMSYFQKKYFQSQVESIEGNKIIISLVSEIETMEEEKP